MSQPRKPHTISGNQFNDDLAYKIDANFDAIFQQNIINQEGVTPVSKGGTNLSSYTKGDLLYADTPGSIAGLHDIATGNVLLSGGVSAAPAYGKVSLNGSPIHVTGTLQPDHGGTGIASYAVGDLLYASAATTLSKLADVATGNALISGGVTTAPSWGKIGLTTHVSGVLPEANGGTNQSTYTTGDLLYASASNTLAKLADVATGNALISGGVATAPSWGKVGLTTHVSGVLPVANGGTNISSYTQGDVIYASGSTTLVTLAKDTNATRYLSNTGSSNNPAWAQVSLTTGVTSTLPVTSGGTGLTSLTQGDILYASASNTLSALAKNTSSTRYLSNTGSSNNPAWALVDLSTGITATLGPGNGGTGLTGVAQGDIIYGSGINTFSILIKTASATRYLSNTGTSNNPAWSTVDLTNGVANQLAIANGGTAASTASGARTNLGLGTMATQDASNVAITGGAVSANGCRGTNVNAFATGTGCEIGYNGTSGFMQAYNYGGAVYIPFLILGSTVGICIGATQVAGWDASGHLTPSADNTYNNGDASFRWKLVRGVTITPGDLQFDNGWTITEAENLDMTVPGLAFLDENDDLVAFIGRNGVVPNINTLTWTKKTHEQRTSGHR